MTTLENHTPRFLSPGYGIFLKDFESLHCEVIYSFCDKLVKQTRTTYETLLEVYQRTIPFMFGENPFRSLEDAFQRSPIQFRGKARGVAHFDSRAISYIALLKDHQPKLHTQFVKALAFQVSKIFFKSFALWIILLMNDRQGTEETCELKKITLKQKITKPVLAFCFIFGYIPPIVLLYWNLILLSLIVLR